MENIRRYVIRRKCKEFVNDFFIHCGFDNGVFFKLLCEFAKKHKYIILYYIILHYIILYLINMPLENAYEMYLNFYLVDQT